ncbi:cysteine desulfurase [Roseospira marina]|uniref:Cysteine desulfurase n=1 Tax=Roseospira marina TaxID=140057 RepID=A0A5M6IB85_9PROT|nr:cysteine desulfurase family protein [Roseospira marina]KAA5605560.1 cysteine desulfurase [Roseospira marina]MBB4313377.1 cysteine desulfurase [Roseospira marina]MBB5085882.1 cysteine desulfurase [Roseospira marina]
MPSAAERTPPVYLDHNASAPLRPEATAAMQATLEITGNPSSIHGHGRRARTVIDDARDAVAALAGVPPAWVVFTGGGSDANALALTGLGTGPRLCSAVEHDSVLRWVPEAGHLPVDPAGRLDLDALSAALEAAPAPGLMSLMRANNETGVLQPVADAAARARAAGWWTHCDAVQTPGRLWPFDFGALGVDLMTLSAHKLGGPAGVGALIVADGVTLAPHVRGGGQERGRRAGTENLVGIAGFGAAAQAVVTEGPAETERLRSLRDRLEAGLLEAGPDAVVHGSGAERLPNTICLGHPTQGADMLLMRLDLAGVSVSSGSACSSGKVTPSHVLRAMGLDETAARRALRFSLGWSTTDADIDRTITVWRAIAA